MRQLLEILAYLHARKISHRDIKLENIIIDRQGQIKLIDFGFSCNAEKPLNTFCGTISYMSPEIVSRKDYDGSLSDVWSAGVLLYILLSGRLPFKAPKPQELCRMIGLMKFQYRDNMNDPTRHFLSQMLCPESKRASAAQLLTS